MSLVTDKIKSLCNTRNIKLEDLVAKSGISFDEFEEIDNSDSIPSLSWLIKIARALKVRPGTFLDDYEEEGPIIHRKNQLSEPNKIAYHLISKTSHLDFYALGTGKAGRYFEPFLIEVKPNERPKISLASFEGEEFIYVLKGKIAIEYGIEKHILNEGDSMYYDSIVGHRITSANGEPATILGIIYSPF